MAAMSRNSAADAPLFVRLGRQSLQGILHLIYPPSCCMCRQPLPLDGSDFCTPCAEALTQDGAMSCPRCAMTIGPYGQGPGCQCCRDESFHFDAAVRLGAYRGPLREAILRMKHSAGENLAYNLAHVWLANRSERLAAANAHCVIPVPLYWLRRLQRGYNQSDTLARVVSKKLGIPCRSRWLKRIRHTGHQTGQSLTARRENMRGAFWAFPRREIQGKTVLLVDDVMTTGSTCDEAAKALKKAGAGRVVVAVLARSEGDGVRHILADPQTSSQPARSFRKHGSALI